MAVGAMLTLAAQQLIPGLSSTRGADSARSHAGGEAQCAKQLVRISQLEQSLSDLRSHVRSLREQSQQHAAVPATATELTPMATDQVSVSSGLVAAGAPPPPKQRWSWTGLVMNTLRPFERLNGGITLRGLRLAEQKCKISTWCHRAQVINGRLYVTDIRAIFFDRHYAMARVMPLLLAMKRFPVPDLDAVFSGTDYPIMEIPRDAAHMGRMYGQGHPIPPVRMP